MPLNSRDLIAQLLLRNRTIVSRDFAESLAVIAREIPLSIHRYPSGEEFGSWQIPPEWNLVFAELRGAAGVIASHHDHPLFVAPYSCSFDGMVSREDLLRHVRSSPRHPDAFVYEYRLAINPQLRLTDWVLTLPHRIVETLNEPEYHVRIVADVHPGHMLVGEGGLEGSEPVSLMLLSHLCHPGQANDGLAGIAACIEVIRQLRERKPTLRYGCRLLVMPETIGSAVWCAARPDAVDNLLGAIFLEMPAAPGRLRFKRSRRGTTYLDRVFSFVLSRAGVVFDDVSFYDAYGNDERIFDFPGVGVPAISLQRYPLETYHTSKDDLSGIDDGQMAEIVRLTSDAMCLIDDDFCVRFRDRIPAYLSRYGLYADAVHARESFAMNTRIVELAWEGLSALDIAFHAGLEPAIVSGYLNQFIGHGLATRVPLTPDYTRLQVAQVGESTRR